MGGLVAGESNAEIVVSRSICNGTDCLDGVEWTAIIQAYQTP